MVIIMLIYALYSDNKYHKTIENGVKSSHIVTRQNCRNYRRSLSGVLINVNGKEYSIKLSSKTCSYFTEQSTINVYYLKEYDEYIYKVKDYKDKFKSVFVFLLISLLPWTYYHNRYISKHLKIKKNKNQ